MDLYKQNIIDHYKYPRNKKVLDLYDVKVEEYNTLCGDKVAFYILLDKKKTKIKDISFTGEGCAISQATASMLTEILKGAKLSELKKLDFDFIKRLLGVEINPARSKCALLAVTALQKLLNNN